jgi:mannose-6-phosphate isomerase-like protein (cupin superfamily)
MHQHVDSFEEVYTILRGTGCMQLGDTVINVKFGDVISVHAHVPRKITNIVDEPLWISEVTFPPWYF